MNGKTFPEDFIPNFDFNNPQIPCKWKSCVAGLGVECGCFLSGDFTPKCKKYINEEAWIKEMRGEK